jgi:ribosomal protein S18 acetylase RimI-like enzyme
MTQAALPNEIEGIRYSICRPAEVAELVGVLARSFSRHDPPAVALGLTQDDFKTFLTFLTATAGEDGLTILARDVASGEMAGALLTEDAGAPAPLDMDAVSPRFAPIYALFGELDGAMGDGEPIESGSTLHLFMLGVDERFARRGIAQRLVKACLANGNLLGYQTAITEATNRTSQHIFAKTGFVTRSEASYADFRHDGVATFASIADQGGIKSMVRPVIMGS